MKDQNVLAYKTLLKSKHFKGYKHIINICELPLWKSDAEVLFPNTSDFTQNVGLYLKRLHFISL